MAAYWAKRCNEHCAFYQFFKKGCSERGKASARDKVETFFEALLRQMRSPRNLVARATALFRDLWEQRNGWLSDRREAQRKAIKLQVTKLRS